MGWGSGGDGPLLRQDSTVDPRKGERTSGSEVLGAFPEGEVTDSSGNGQLGAGLPIEAFILSSSEIRQNLLSQQSPSHDIPLQPLALELFRGTQAQTHSVGTF